MHKAKQGNIWYWICYRHVNGVNCNRGKFGNSKFYRPHSLDNPERSKDDLEFVNGLNIDQCTHLCCISNKIYHTVVEYYADRRAVCNAWIWNENNTR